MPMSKAKKSRSISSLIRLKRNVLLDFGIERAAIDSFLNQNFNDARELDCKTDSLIYLHFSNLEKAEKEASKKKELPNAAMQLV